VGNPINTLPDFVGRIDERISDCDEDAPVAMLASYEGVKMAMVAFFGGGFLVARSSSLLSEELI
jgi:hypothetical protein